MAELNDRKSHGPGSTVNAPAKKGGGGGQFTWGRPGDVQDYDAVGGQGDVKVTVSAAPKSHNSSTSSKQGQAAAPPIPRDTSAEFPRLGNGPALQATALHGYWGEKEKEKEDLKSAKANLVAGTLLVAGGAVGFARKGSIASLLGGGISGLAYLSLAFPTCIHSGDAPQ
eukprot:TRINITY_DN25415_c0_g1_i1.p1 TRINITY_DN25415_c0_g1~~TRINITY_DN25415_c0_g1_i1.p1  ORF type:complete len:179 (+),score=44.19 TRINITY_DN25415_c0_g1_i1:33-539(+)